LGADAVAGHPKYVAVKAHVGFGVLATAKGAVLAVLPSLAASPAASFASFAASFAAASAF